nr:MAG TPA: hypothetical protein [Caudoviricetes sp.]
MIFKVLELFFLLIITLFGVFIVAILCKKMWQELKK